MRINIFLFLLIVFCQPAFCQQRPGLDKMPPRPQLSRGKLLMAARAGKGEIMLRWAPDNAITWKQANEYGYILERYTISRDSMMLPKVEKITSKRIIKPLPLNNWDSLTAKNDYAAVLAQAIYGNDFEVEVKDESRIGKFIDQTEERQQRYAMALYAADHDFLSARYAGLGWIDKTVRPNEKYLYRVLTLIPKSKAVTDTALAYVGLQDYKPLPKPSDIFADFGDKSVMLSWDFDGYVQYYNSYYVERSSDGGLTYSKASDLPITRSNGNIDSNSMKPGTILFLDSLKNNIEYQYRVAGVTPFGEVGPYSESVTGKGKAVLASTPNITGITLDAYGKLKLNWQFEDTLTSLVREFEIKSAGTIDGTYSTIAKNIRPESRDIVLDSLPAVSYVTVTAVPFEGQAKTSYPYLVQPEDSVAPASPVGFQGTIDSTGVVTLRWQPNGEKDLLGYKILRTNVRGNEYSTVLDSIWKQTEFRDTVNIKDLNKKIFYIISAVDQHYNQSIYSSVVEIKKPDVIPPTQAVFSNYELNESELTIEWENSSDSDVAKHILYRKESGGSPTPWEKLQDISDLKTKKYIDKIKEGEHNYSYTIIAVDSSGLESAPAIPLTVSIPKQRIKQAVSKIDAEVDRDARKLLIFWKLSASDIAQLELYRGEDKTPISLYKVFPGDTQEFTDEELRVNTKYKYAIRAVYKDGRYSDFKMKNITY